MKRLLYSIMVCSALVGPLGTEAQGIKIMPGTTFKSAGRAYTIVLHNASFTSTGPVTADSLIFRGSGDTAAITGTGPLALQRVQVGMSSGHAMTLGRDLNVHQEVAFYTGLLDLAGHNVMLDSAAVLTGENDLARAIAPGGGEFRIIQTLDAPLAEQPGNLGIIITSSAYLGPTLIRRGHKVQSSAVTGGHSIARYYEIEPASNSGLGAILRSYYLTPELNGQQEATLTYARSNDGGVHWTNAGAASRNTTQNFVNLSGVQSMARFTLSDMANPLPLHLLGWSADCKGTAVHLQWKVADSRTAARFIVEESDDAGRWHTGTLIAATAATAYSATDASPSPYYRLRIEEQDGTASYSGVLSVHCGGQDKDTYSLLQNPVHSRLTLATRTARPGTLRVRLSDPLGRILEARQEAIPAGAYSFSIDVAALAAGSYQLLVTDDQGLPVLQTKVAVQ